MREKLKVGDSQTVSTCKANRSSAWGNGTPRKTTAGMKEVVTISKNSRGQKISTTTYK